MKAPPEHWDGSIQTHVQYRMGKYFDHLTPITQTFLGVPLDRHGVVLEFVNGILKHNPDRKADPREAGLCDLLEELAVPQADFFIVLHGGDSPLGHDGIPLFCHFRPSHSDHMILWPLSEYTTIDSWHFGHGTGDKDCEWREKSNLAVWRGTSTGFEIDNMSESDILALSNQPHRLYDPIRNTTVVRANRLELVRRFHADEMLDVGFSSYEQIDEKAQSFFTGAGFKKDYISYEELLAYKYLVVVDGNSFASQLPWALHSKSVVLMAPPAWESIVKDITPWKHFVPLAVDFSDLKEKVEWCRAHDAECQAIAIAATELMKEYYNVELEQLIRQQLLERYVRNFALR